MSEMVERVAKALYVKIVGESEDFLGCWKGVGDEIQSDYRDYARAAIEAMRVPTPDTEALRMWNHMLDEALK